MAAIRFSFRLFLFCLQDIFRPSVGAAGLLFVIAACVTGCGSSSSTPPLSPPSNLSYAQSSISAVVNRAITADTPAVTGTVTSYAVSPALPAGLGLNSSTGAIAGTPTAASPKASYTVTASNSGGATTANVQILVATPLLAPTGLVYPQTVINTYVGQALTPDIPAPSGTITAYAISQALPPGLSMDPFTGVISGTPTAVSAQATYVVTGSNSGGSIQANVSPTITVNATPTILLQADNQYGIAAPQFIQYSSALQFVDSSVFSEDFYGIWALRDYNSGAILVSGDAGLSTNNQVSYFPPGQMAGPTLAVGVVGGIQVLSSATGMPMGTVVSPGWTSQPVQTGGTPSETDFWKLASDGSYIAVATQTGVSVFSPTGQLLCSKGGAYMAAGSSGFFAAPGKLFVANGPFGANAIETIAVPNCTSTVSAAYQGGEPVWFADGSRFITETGGNIHTPLTVWVYSNSGTLQATTQTPVFQGAVSVPSPSPWKGGVGNWIWTFVDGPLPVGPVLTIYPVGSSTAALTETAGISGVYQVSGTAIGLLPDSKTVSVIDLSGPVAAKAHYPIPATLAVSFSETNPVTAFAAVSSTRWVAATQRLLSTFSSGNGSILDGASLATSSPRYIGRGGVLSSVGSTANVALATGNGQISIFDASNATPLETISVDTEELALSTDGSVLAAGRSDGTLLNIYSLPSGTLSESLSYPSQSTPGLLSNFTMSGTGTDLGINLVTISPNNARIYQPQIIPAAGSPVIWSGPTTQDYYRSVVFSPDGAFAVVTTGAEPSSTASILKYGQLITAVSGDAVGWIDNGRLLVNSYAYQADGSGPYFSYCTIYSPTGAVLASPPLPELRSIQPVTSDTVYSPEKNAIYSLTTGQATWTSPYLPDAAFAVPAGGVGAISGSYVVFESQGRVIAVPY